MRIILVGQPNAGKSTIFNAIAGYRAATANFPGTSVSFLESRTLLGDRELEVVDLPGTYSLTSQDAAEQEALRYLLEHRDDTVLVDVIDACHLGRSLELTLQLMELGLPMVVALNMLDDTRRKGIEIDPEALSRELGIPVVPTIARRGRGIAELVREAVRAGEERRVPRPILCDLEVEDAIRQVIALLDGRPPLGAPPRLAAVKLLERDPLFHRRLREERPEIVDRVEEVIRHLEEIHGWPADQVVSGERHALAHRVEERVSRLHPPRPSRREKLDRLLMSPFTGLPVMLIVLLALFWLVFGVGQRLEEPLVALFDGWNAALARSFPPTTLLGAVLNGAVLGLSAGLAIVLPYLVPFLVVLALLEDSGYLPRMAYLLDGLMHRIGLHGKSIVPLMLGYGCTVPAVMATRILESPRDRRVTAALTVLVPCSARTIVILGLVGAVLGPWAALGVYVANVLVVAGLGAILGRKVRGPSPGLLLEVPDLRPPALRTLGARVWVSLKDFLVIAWPLLVASSIVLSGLELFGWTEGLNRALAPFTHGLLGLPAAVGLTLVFGVLRKELALMMLVQALGTTDLATALSPAQALTFTVFVVFYVPCVATIAALWRELGGRDTAWITGMTIVLATALAVAVRVLSAALG